MLPSFYRTSGNYFLNYYTSVATFLLGAMALVVPSGYSLGAVMLVLGSLVLLTKRSMLELDREDWSIIAVLTVFSVLGMAEAWWDGQGASGFDKPTRYLLAIPALLLVMAFPPRLAWMWSGLALGAIGAGSWAGWQKLVLSIDRAQGHTHVIQFGNLSMLLGVLCVSGLGWAAAKTRNKLWLTILSLGAVAGVLGSLFSGARGGWVGIPFIMLVLYRGYGRQLSLSLKLFVLVLVVMAGSLAYGLPQTGVQWRVHMALSDISSYVSGETAQSSVGARFEMWKGATQLILEKPLTGWGENGYQQGMQDLADAGAIDPYVLRYGHAHNEYLDIFAKRGMLGFLSLLALYLVPLVLFSRGFSTSDLAQRSVAVAGALLSVTYIDFSLTQTFLAHNSGTMMFAFLLAVLWGCFRATGRPQAAP